MAKSGDTDPEVPKEDQQNEPNPVGGGNRDEEAGESQFKEDMENDPARAGTDSPAEGLQGG